MTHHLPWESCECGKTIPTKSQRRRKKPKPAVVQPVDSDVSVRAVPSAVESNRRRH